MNTLKDVKAQMRSAAGDPDGSWLTDGYIVPIINHCYVLQINYLKNTHVPFMEKVAVLPNLAVGQSDLSTYQNDPKQPLYGLLNPDKDDVYWKPSGQTDNNYRMALKTERLPDLNPSTPGPRWSMWWEWRAFRMFITPMTFIVDLRVRGEFRPPPLLKDDDVITIYPMMDAVLAEEALACAWRERQNPGQLQNYQLEFTQALDDICNDLVSQSQGTPLRIARASGRRGWR